jgi:hypothetical protein
MQNLERKKLRLLYCTVQYSNYCNVQHCNARPVLLHCAIVPAQSGIQSEPHVRCITWFVTALQ